MSSNISSSLISFFQQIFSLLCLVWLFSLTQDDLHKAVATGHRLLNSKYNSIVSPQIANLNQPALGSMYLNTFHDWIHSSYTKINQEQCVLIIALIYLVLRAYLPGEPSCGERVSPGGGVFQPGWRGHRRHTVWQHGTAERQEAAQSYTHPRYTLASSSLPAVGEGRSTDREIIGWLWRHWFS